MTGDYMVRALERLTAVPGSPALVRVGNGTEMTSNVIADWCRFSPSGIEFIDPGSPWQNPFVQSFNGKSHEELLAVEQFHTLPETKIMAENYRKHYNQYRPNSSLGYRTPNEFTLHWANNNPGLTKMLTHKSGAGHLPRAGSWVSPYRVTTGGEDPMVGWR